MREWSEECLLGMTRFGSFFSCVADEDGLSKFDGGLVNEEKEGAMITGAATKPARATSRCSEYVSMLQWY